MRRHQLRPAAPGPQPAPARHPLPPSCRQLSDAGLAHLTHLHAVGAEVPVLADLYLQDGQKSTNLYMHYISQGLHITALDLSFCADISDSG